MLNHFNDIRLPQDVPVTHYGDTAGNYVVRKVGVRIEVYRNGELIRVVDAPSLSDTDTFRLYVVGDNNHGVNVQAAAVAIDDVSLQP